MKNAAYILPMLFLLLLPLVAAEAPDFVSQVELNGSAGIFTRMYSIDDTHLIIWDRINGASTCRLRIFNPITGELTDQAGLTCTYPVDIHYDSGTILACYAYNDAGVSGFNHRLAVYKLPEDGLLQFKASTSETNVASLTQFSRCKLESSGSNSAQVFLNGWDAKSGSGVLYFNNTFDFTEEPILVPRQAGHTTMYDTSADVFPSGNSFYDNSDPYNNSGEILSTLTNADTIRTWNFNTGNPEYASANGYIAIVDDYEDPLESSGSVSVDDIVAYKSRSNVISIINGTWWTADFTNAGNPTLTDTGVEITNYDPSPLTGGTGTYEFHTTSTNIYYMNQTNDILSTWEYQIAPTCSASEGCYIDDDFSYGDSILNHGWSGTGVSPIDGELECFQNAGRYHRYYFTPITQSTGTFYLDFDATMCGSSTSELYLSLYSSNDLAWNIRMKADALGGTIQDHQSAYLTYSIGDNVTDTEGWCSGLDRFENSYKVVFYPQNTPKTYDIYINDVVVSEGNEWTTIGQNLLSVNNLDIGVSPTTPYCWWRLDNIHLYTVPLDQQLTDDEIEDARNTIGGIEMSLDTQFHFDRDEHCEVTENSQLCFLRWVFGGILDWLWRLVINNPLQSLAFILVAIVLVVAGYNSRR